MFKQYIEELNKLENIVRLNKIKKSNWAGKSIDQIITNMAKSWCIEDQFLAILLKNDIKAKLVGSDKNRTLVDKPDCTPDILIKDKCYIELISDIEKKNWSKLKINGGKRYIGKNLKLPLYYIWLIGEECYIREYQEGIWEYEREDSLTMKQLMERFKNDNS